MTWNTITDYSRENDGIKHHDFMIKNDTVKPVYNGHPQKTENLFSRQRIA